LTIFLGGVTVRLGFIPLILFLSVVGAFMGGFLGSLDKRGLRISYFQAMVADGLIRIGFLRFIASQFHMGSFLLSGGKFISVVDHG